MRHSVLRVHNSPAPPPGSLSNLLRKNIKLWEGRYYGCGEEYNVGKGSNSICSNILRLLGRISSEDKWGREGMDINLIRGKKIKILKKIYKVVGNFINLWDGHKWNKILPGPIVIWEDKCCSVCPDIFSIWNSIF